jgi:prefoldin subunit 5
VYCDSLKVTGEATLPITTKLIFEGGDDSLVRVDKGITTYNSIADIIKYLQQTEERYSETVSSLETKLDRIEVTYLSTPQSPNSFTPTAEDSAWTTTIPAWKDEEYI